MKKALHDSPFDIGVIGEGEVTMLELIQMFEKRGSFNHKNLKEIRGLAYKKASNEINFSGSRKWIEDLDSIPFPARELMKIKYYLRPREWFSGFYAKALQIMASRGCPYGCAFALRP
ncbi:MAG: hypothetical protein ACUVTL_05655 [Thermoproteota archaeon]